MSSFITLYFYYTTTSQHTPQIHSQHPPQIHSQHSINTFTTPYTNTFTTPHKYLHNTTQPYNMPTTTYQTIDVDSRNHIIRHRDTLKKQFAIDIFFPRDKVRGQFQDMALVGPPSYIFEAQKKIATILADWQREFDAFKERRARRRQQSRMAADEAYSPVGWPSVSTHTIDTTTHTRYSKNQFDALTIDEESIVEVVPVVTHKKNTLTGWSKVVTGHHTSSSPSPVPTECESWADMSDDEE